LDCAGEYYVEHPNDQEFFDLVLSMLDEPELRIRLIVDDFSSLADRKKKQQPSERQSGTGAVDSATAARYMGLYVLAVKAEATWRAPVKLSIDELKSEAKLGEKLSYRVTARNRAGRFASVPPNLLVEVEPADKLIHDGVARTIAPRDPGRYTVRASTPDGALNVEREFNVREPERPNIPPPPAAAITPEGGVIEIGDQLKLSVTANPTLAKRGWQFDWEPKELVYGLTTAQDTAKLVMTLVGRRSGVAALRVASDTASMCQAKLYILPPQASLKIPVAWTSALVVSVAAAIRANDQDNITARRWLTFGAIPIVSVGTVKSWMNYRRIKNARRKFLEQVPQTQGLQKPALAATR